MNNKHKPDISLYIHFPWCIKKCPYCDFNSHVAPTAIPEQKYIHKLLNELAQYKDYLDTSVIQTIFLGGGTPSIISGHSIKILLNAILTEYQCKDDLEITMEVNPGTAEIKYLKEYFAAGINRLSFGAQSFSDQQLRRLGRIHKSSETIKAIHTAREIGFNNINLDIMYGLEKQSIKAAVKDLEQTIALQPQHISWYQLTIEPHTAFAHSPPQLPLDDNIIEMQNQGQALLANAGYQQYEVSAYCQPKRQCRHNLNYWQFGDYLGIGAGAHSKLTTSAGKLRHWNLKQPKHYLNSNNVQAGNRTIPPKELIFEYFMNRMRLKQAISEAEFTRHTGCKFDHIQQKLAYLTGEELICWQENIELTAKGELFLNNILQQFIE